MPLDIHGICPLLQVFDMPTAFSFYKDILGFEVVSTSPVRDGHFDWAWLRLNGAELMLNTAYEQDARPMAPDPTRVAAHDDMCLYFGCPEVDAAYEYLKTQGVQLNPPKNAHYGMRQLYFTIRTATTSVSSGRSKRPKPRFPTPEADISCDDGEMARWQRLYHERVACLFA